MVCLKLEHPTITNHIAICGYIPRVRTDPYMLTSEMVPMASFGQEEPAKPKKPKKVAGAAGCSEKVADASDS